MQLRDTRLLLVILGIPNSSNLQQQRTAAPIPDLYSRASSSEGLLCIRKYWDAHCSTFSKVPVLALVDAGSCPKGLAPALFLELLSRLTDLAAWQIWDLWTMLDIHSCGFVGCAEFSLLVVLLCAGVARQQLRAVHAYSRSICRTFLGPHVGSSAGGLCQCCQLMGLPVSALFTALQQQQQQHMHAGGGGSSSSSEWRIAAACCRPELQACCSNTLGASSASSTRSSSSRQQGQAQGEDKLAAATSPLGCCCQDSASMPADGRPQQWACGAAAHRQHCSRLAAGGACAAATPGGSHTLHTDTLMSAEDVELVLYQVAQRHAARQEGSAGRDAVDAEVFSAGCCAMC